MFKSRHVGHQARRRGGEVAEFRHLKEILVGVLPGMSAGIMRRRAAADELILELPQRLTLKPAAMAAGAVLSIDLRTLRHQNFAVGIGEV